MSNSSSSASVNIGSWVLFAFIVLVCDYLHPEWGFPLWVVMLAWVAMLFLFIAVLFMLFVLYVLSNNESYPW